MSTHRPAHEVELYRDGDAYSVIVDLPDFDREDVEVRFHDGRLHVEGEHLDPDDGQRAIFNRHVGLPKLVDVENIEATFEDGILEVTLPIAGEDIVRGVTVDVE
jgi:HSP20 family protein